MGNMKADKALRFSLRMAYERIEELIEEYNNNISKGRETVQSHVYNRPKGYIAIYFWTYAYFIFVYQGAYMITWHHKGDDGIFHQDGIDTCKDVSEVMRTMHNMIFGGFSPRRGSLWHQYGKE